MEMFVRWPTLLMRNSMATQLNPGESAAVDACRIFTHEANAHYQYSAPNIFQGLIFSAIARRRSSSVVSGRNG